jgi:hypothetical protein
LFELHGLDPEQAVPVYFLDDVHEWGAAVEFSGKQAGEDVTVRLQPNGQARARFVGPDGKPIAKLAPFVEILATPDDRNEKDRGKLLPDAAWLAGVDPKHYSRSRRPVTDAEGRVTLPDLIPGTPYRIDVGGGMPRKDFTLRPGETLDLGDFVIEKPSS